VRSYLVVYRGKDGSDISLGYKSFRVMTATRQIPEQEKVWAFMNQKADGVFKHNLWAQFPLWNAYWTQDDFNNNPAAPAFSTDGLGLVPFFDIRTAGDDPYTVHRRLHVFPNQINTGK
jgi:hypothetical protein